MERRRYVRFPKPVKIVIRSAGREETCFTLEVALGGCGVTLSRRLAEGTLLNVELSSTRLAQPVSGTAQVVWTTTAAPWRTGIEFSASLMEAMGPFLKALVGDAPLRTKAGEE